MFIDPLQHQIGANQRSRNEIVLSIIEVSVSRFQRSERKKKPSVFMASKTISLISAILCFSATLQTIVYLQRHYENADD